METGTSGDTKFGTNVSNKKLLNTAKCQGYTLYRYRVIKGKSRGCVEREDKITPPPSPPPRLGLTTEVNIRGVLKVTCSYKNIDKSVKDNLSKCR